MMTSFERVMRTMQHRQTDRVPLFYRDVPEVEQRLLKDLQLPDRESLLQHFEIDFRWVGPEYVGPSLEDLATGRRRDVWGVEYRYVSFQEYGGYWEVVDPPLQHCDGITALDDYPWPQLEWFDFSSVPSQCETYRNYAVMTAPGPASPGVLLTIQNLLGEERAWMDLAANPEFFDALTERVLAFDLALLERLMDVAAGGIQFLRIGDDFGSQRGLLIGAGMWRERIQPALKAIAAIARKHGAFYYHHSCGGIRDLIPDLIETGVDVLDPVQVLAAGMDPAELKSEFGKRLCFSGGVDEQELLSQGTPEQVRQGVHSLLETMAPGGGFFLGPTHNLQQDIPTANILAMYDTAMEWRY